MKMNKLWTVFVFLRMLITVESMFPWFDVGLEIALNINQIWKGVDKKVNEGNKTPWPEFLNEEDSQISDQIAGINDNIENLNRKLDKVESKMMDIINNIPDAVGLEIKRNELQMYLAIIDNNYMRMSHYMQNTTAYEKSTLLDFARSTISHDSSSIYSIIQRLYGSLLSRGDSFSNPGIINYLVRKLNHKESTFLCNKYQSPQQVIQILYDTLGVAAVKSYTMIQFSYMILKLNGDGNYTQESINLEKTFQGNINKTVGVISDVMQLVLSDLWICDPQKHIQGGTYTEITELLQGYIQNEADLTPEGTCWSTCAAYTNTKSYSCYKGLFCREQRQCNGKITSCRFVDSSSTVCLAERGKNRRYQYITWGNGERFGERTDRCQGGVTRADSWWRWLFWHCSYCVCLCDEQGSNSDRYFNLRPVEANSQHNRVITGMRFMKSNRVIHLQIQTGKMLAGVSIDSDTVRWLPIKEYRITDPGVYNGKDFHTLTSTDRTMDLDDLKGEYNEVLTGVRLDLKNSHLRLAIRLHRFDHLTGKVTNNFIWKTSVKGLCNIYNTINLENLDVPTSNRGKSVPDSTSGQCLQFTNTGFKQDAAQSTVPFIDTQHVASSVPMPLSGAGIYHKGSSGYGGFIAPKLLTYDYTKLLKISLK